MSEKILVTTALPYSNGSIHLGHVLEGIQADIYVRFQKAIGNECYFFCADDTHGTPIMIAASKAGVTPKEFINQVHSEHYKDLTAFGINYDNYYSTDSPENQALAEKIYLTLKANGNISSRNIEQAYCEHDKMFLPDRFIKGTCPKCGSKDQYGDSCEVCGAIYSSTDLKNPHCAICGNLPITKESTHLFFRLQDYQNELKSWIETEGRLPEGGKKKLMEWFVSGLKEWDISREGPYFGFPIPEEENKFFYVWLDAPIGYMASSKNFFSDNEGLFNLFWKEGEGKIVHFIGKDILYFHGLFWPAMLIGSGFKSPSKLHIHGFMTVNGEKMSKSRGTFINASTFVKYNDPEHFRYYMAARLGSGMDDVDISFEDYLSRVNSDLIGNLVNIISRIATSIFDKIERKLGTIDKDGNELIDKLLAKESEIRKSYEDKNYQKVIRDITLLGDVVNKYVNDKAPWITVKNDSIITRQVLTNALNAGFILFTYLYPVVPNISRKVYSLMGILEEPNFSFLNKKFENLLIPPYTPLSNRASEKDIQKMMDTIKLGEINQNKEIQTTPELNHSVNTQTNTLNQINDGESSKLGLISIEDVKKVHLRVGLILESKNVVGSDRLLQLKVDLGDHGIKNIFAGIKCSYTADELIHLKVVVVANLNPRKMKFGTSEAMVLASGEDNNLSLFIPHKNAQPGDLLN